MDEENNCNWLEMEDADRELDWLSLIKRAEEYFERHWWIMPQEQLDMILKRDGLK